jgi:DNA ligase (NAD+)
VLAENFASIEALQSATLEELQEVPDVGPKIGESVINFFADKHNRDIIGKLKNAGVTLAGSTSKKNGKLSGLTFVLTGALATYTRDVAKQMIEGYGGTVASGISKNVQYVLAGAEAGSKLAKAKKLGIPVISEEEFMTMIR